MASSPVTNIHKALTQEDIWLNTSRKLDAEDLKGRIILVDFWTFCCINCIHVIPELQELEEAFGNDLTVIGVHSAKFANEKDSENIRQAILRYGIEHPVVNDSDFRIWQSFGVRAWPTLMLINPLGKIETVYSGEGHIEALRDDINRLRKTYASVLNNNPLPIALEKETTPKSLLSFPGKLAYAKDSAFGEVLFISDSGHHQIRIVNRQGEIIETIGSGNTGFVDGTLKEAQFNTPQGLLYRDNILYVADTENHLLRKIDLSSKMVATLAGTGERGYNRYASNAAAKRTALASPWDLAFYPDESHITIAMAGTHQLWVYDLKKKTVGVLAGNGRESIDDGRHPLNSLSQPSGLSVTGDTLYFVDSETSSLRQLEGKAITTLIGTGLFDFGYKEGNRYKAKMQHALGVYAEEDNVYIADSYNHSIRRYDIDKAYLNDYAGQGERGKRNGPLNMALFNEPNDILRVGDKLYITDTNNHLIRVIDMTSDQVSTLPIIPQAEAQTYSYSQSPLPNERKLEHASLFENEESPLMLNLPKGWKINDDAPSWIALFSKENNEYNSIAQFDTKALKEDKIIFPKATPEREYILQGTLYYCEDSPLSQCFIQSINQELPIADKKSSSIEVNFMIPN